LTKICRGTPNLVKIGQQCRPFYMNTCIVDSSAICPAARQLCKGNPLLPLVATPNGIVLLIAMCRATVVFPCQQWLRDFAALLRCTYTVYLVYEHLSSEDTASDVTNFLFCIRNGMRVLESLHCINFPEAHF